MPSEIKSFEDLVNKRKEFVRSARENNVYDGIKRVLSYLYPDVAHFVHELLQNAQDASKNNKSSTTVRFTLTNNELRFEHNGEKLFDFDDTEAILSIGEGTKRNDDTSIGKFGAGFKSVFAYTTTPRVYSGEYNFEISDLVVPEVISGIDNGSKTVFVLPFNNPDKAPHQAVKEIEKMLCGLGSETLLFLSKINRIEYTLPSSEKIHFITRTNNKDGTMTIRSDSENQNKEFHWLRYDRTVRVIFPDGRAVVCPIAVAFRLERNTQKERKVDWNIVPVKGKVCIYFPAEKETSNLNFHINAPFASTVARDSIRDCEENTALRRALGKLVAASLDDIKKRGLLNMSFLAVLPNDEDDLDEYSSIRDAIISAFKTNPLLPTKSGAYAPSSKLYRTPIGKERISNIVEDSDLSLLTGKPTPLWVQNTNTQVRRQGLFLDSLSIAEWGVKELGITLNPRSSNNSTQIEMWIHGKPDQWLLQLYALLEDERITVDKNLKLARTTDLSHVMATDAYFSVDSKICDLVVGKSIILVKIDTYHSAGDSRRSQSAKSFLERIGVREFDTNVYVETRLSRYESRIKEVTENDHLEDISFFLDYLKNAPEKNTIFRRRLQFRCLLDGMTPSWVQADLLYIDTPYSDTGLAQVRSIHRKHPLWEGYQKTLPLDDISILLGLLTFLGALSKLRIIGVPITNNPHFKSLYQYGKNTQYGINQDYIIENIDRYIAHKTVAASRLIWNAIISAERDISKARFRPNRESPTKTADSQIVCILAKAAWIPDINGNFRTPRNMIETMLLPEFVYDDGNGMLSAIGFGLEARLIDDEAKDKQQKLKSAADTLGISSESVALLIEAEESGVDIRQVLGNAIQFELERKRPDFPIFVSPNPRRREDEVAKEYLEEDTISYGPTVGSKRESEPAYNPKVWLRDQYTNAYKEMVCQMCEMEMPFKGRDGKYYFEAISAFNTPKVKRITRESEINYLALCPLCAAKFVEFIQRDDDAMDLFVSSFCENDDCTVPLMLGDEASSVRFTKQHMADLKTILNIEK
ncbi:MAG: hypothetical protein FWH57_07780 [Oscillospiraceae bacterium]|nr:hypothetical protein [Oscillospiraceae bacterium]